VATIVRQHYRVTFKPTETFMPTSGMNLRIPMRPRILEPRLVNCTSLPCLLNFSASHCIAMKPVVDKFSEIQTHMSHMLIDVLSRIEYLIPARPPPSSRTRHTRSWLPFIGDALKTVAGTATTVDIQKELRSIEDTRRTTAQAYTQCPGLNQK